MRNPKNGKTISKQNLPSKVCVVCNRPFTWRKKWEKVWDEVSTCSKSCNASRRKGNSNSKDDDEGLNTDLSTTTETVNIIDPNKELTKKQLLRKQRKDDVKIKKQERRLKREGNASPDVGRKPCDLCFKNVDMLIRCTIDETQKYKMICGKCWPTISGGIPDGNSNTHPYYTYGGLWKNRNASSNIKKRIGNGSNNKKGTAIATATTTTNTPSSVIYDEEYDDDELKLINEEMKNTLHIQTDYDNDN
jgi:hypothetical protein